MTAQLIQNNNGKTTGVFISIRDWKQLKKKYKELETLEDSEPTKEQFLNNLKQAVKEVNLIKQGKLKGRPARELFDEL